MGQTTDHLYEQAKALSPAPLRREMDMLLSTGERVSMSLLAIALNDLGVRAVSYTGSQSGIITCDGHSNARISEIKADRILKSLEEGKVVIVAGFQGVSQKKEITPLGRGGSDTSAVALAVTLQAKGCEVFTDVDGVFSGDPRFLKKTRRLLFLRLCLMNCPTVYLTKQ